MNEHPLHDETKTPRPVDASSGEEPMRADLREFIFAERKRPGSLIHVLHRVQEEYGYVPRNIAFEVAELLQVPLARVYGVVTFYNFFRVVKPGRHRLAVCLGTACYLKGGQELLRELEELLGVGVDQTTPDGLFSVHAVRCLGCCGLAPVVMVDDQVYGNVRKEDLPALLAKYRGF